MLGVGCWKHKPPGVLERRQGQGLMSGLMAREGERHKGAIPLPLSRIHHAPALRGRDPGTVRRPASPGVARSDRLGRACNRTGARCAPPARRPSLRTNDRLTVKRRRLREVQMWGHLMSQHSSRPVIEVRRPVSVPSCNFTLFVRARARLCCCFMASVATGAPGSPFWKACPFRGM